MTTFVFLITFVLTASSARQEAVDAVKQRFELQIQLADHFYLGTVVKKKAKLSYEVGRYETESQSYFQTASFNVCFLDPKVDLKVGGKYLFFLLEQNLRGEDGDKCYWLGSHNHQPFVVPVVDSSSNEDFYGLIVDRKLVYPTCFTPNLSTEKTDYGWRSNYYLLKPAYLSQCLFEIQSKLSKEKRKLYENMDDQAIHSWENT